MGGGGLVWRGGGVQVGRIRNCFGRIRLNIAEKQLHYITSL